MNFHKLKQRYFLIEAKVKPESHVAVYRTARKLINYMIDWLIDHGSRVSELKIHVMGDDIIITDGEREEQNNG